MTRDEAAMRTLSFSRSDSDSSFSLSFVASVLVAVALTLVAGCGGRHFALTAPGNFIELDPRVQESYGYRYRATTADGVVIGVREIENERHGSPAFWLDAIRNSLRREGGYALLEESDVHAATGESGHTLRFGRDEDADPYTYWLTLFVTNDRIYLIEAGGRRETFAAAQADVEAAIAAFRIQ